jgi:hypothetical protein
MGQTSKSNTRYYIRSNAIQMSHLRVEIEYPILNLNSNVMASFSCDWKLTE